MKKVLFLWCGVCLTFPWFLSIRIGTPNVPMMAMSEAKRNYMSKDMMDWIDFWGGVPFNFSPVFPLRTPTALRAVIVEPKTFHVICKLAFHTL